MTNWHKSCRRLAQWLADDARLAPQWTPESAGDMLWSLMSLDLLERLIIDRRWSRRAFTNHYAAMLKAAFVTGR